MASDSGSECGDFVYSKKEPQPYLYEPSAGLSTAQNNTDTSSESLEGEDVEPLDCTFQDASSWFVYFLPSLPTGPVFTNMDQAEQKNCLKITENGSTNLWLKSVFTKKGSAEPKNLKNFT